MTLSSPSLIFPGTGCTRIYKEIPSGWVFDPSTRLLVVDHYTFIGTRVRTVDLFVSIPRSTSAGSLGLGSTPRVRVPGLPIRDCAGSSNNLAQMCLKLSTIDMTKKIFFERLYLAPGLGTFGPGVNFPCAPTPPPFTQQLFLDFCKFFSLNGPSFF